MKKPIVRMLIRTAVPRNLHGPLRRTLASLRQVIEIRHNLSIIVVPHESIVDNRGGSGFACFAPWNRRIYLAAGLANLVPARERVEALASTLAHELVHYEQFRDKKPLTDRGVQRRADALLRRATNGL